MTEVWIVIAGLVAGTAAIKAAGPVLLGGRSLPDPMSAVIALLVPALLAALIVVDTFSAGQSLRVDERVVGVLAAGGVLALGRGIVPAVIVAAAVTAATRALL